MARKKEPEKPVNHERWLLTYADLITLLMIFFVVLYALSMIDAGKYKQLAESLNVALGVGNPRNVTNFEGGVMSPFNSQPTDVDKVKEQQIEEYEARKKSMSEDSRAFMSEGAQNEKEAEAQEEQKLEKVKAMIDNYLVENGMTTNVTTQLEERGLVIRVNESLLFDSGQSFIKPAFRKNLIDIATILKKINNYVRIEGHTDNIPIHTGQYRSNWQLSTDRATNVTEVLIDGARIPPVRLSAVGYSEYRPIASNAQAAGRAKNRRVDILIINNKFSTVEG